MKRSTQISEMEPETPKPKREKDIGNPIEPLSVVWVLCALGVIFSYRALLLAFTKEHPGITLVLVATLGLGCADWHEFKKGSRGLWKAFFNFLLVLGLTIALLEAADQDKKTSEANTLAGQALERAALTESNNLVLRSNVVVLELKIKPRIITPAQVTNFVFLTQRITKIPIKVCVGMNGQMSYAGQIRSMLSQAGFGIDSSVNASAGVTYYQNVTPIRPPGEDYEWPYVMFLRYGTNHSKGVIAEPGFFENVNGFVRPITVNTNDKNEIIVNVAFVFQQIGIPAKFMRDAFYVGPGEVGILVPPKND